MRDEIKELVDSWNPIGVDGLPDDEYDCLVGKISLWLEAGHTQNDLIFLIDNDLQEHFSLELDPDEVSEFVEKLFDIPSGSPDAHEGAPELLVDDQ
jgi:hypothetical protein